MGMENLDGGCHRVCLTPTRNESWIIQRFLAASKLWASHIIVADQGSTDGTLQQLHDTAGVQTFSNDSPVYDEVRRQRLLIEQARKIPGRRLFIALDADEALSANCVRSKEWEKISEAAPGTVLRFRWVNVLPGFKEAWIPKERIACGFVDDGSEHTGTRIHSRRVPWPDGAPVIDFEDIVVLHFQFVVGDRVASKHRWYQAWERVNHPQKRALQIFREYHHMHGSWEKNEIHPLRPEWLDEYQRAGVDFRSLAGEEITWWDRELVQMLLEHGPQHFRKLAIWDKDWNEEARMMARGDVNLKDPRSTAEKVAHRLLTATQRHRSNWGVRGFEFLLRKLGW